MVSRARRSVSALNLAVIERSRTGRFIRDTGTVMDDRGV
jgi:hypothetical protein